VTDKHKLFKAPEKASSVMDALQQRMAKYKDAEQQAREEGSSSKMKRMGRIVKVGMLFKYLCCVCEPVTVNLVWPAVCVCYCLWSFCFLTVKSFVLLQKYFVAMGNWEPATDTSETHT